MAMSLALLPHAIARHAETRGDAVAFAWIEGDREAPSRSLTYRELHGQATAVARALTARGLRGTCVLLPFPPGLDFVVAFVGCLYAGAIAVPAPFPQNRRTLSRTRAIHLDCEPALCLAPKAWIASLSARLLDADGHPTRCPCVALETLLDERPDTGLLPGLELAQLAYLQYTSGTGGTARGAMITHANLSHNIAALQQITHHPPERPMVSWLPHHHDMQLVVILTRSLMIGATTYLMSPVDFLQRPLRWLRLLARTGAYTSGAPNFAYEHCVHRIAPPELVGLDLSSWGIAFNSSEIVRPATLERFARLVAGCGFKPAAWYPAFGLAEAIGIVTGVSVEEIPIIRANPQSGQPAVSCGRPVTGDQVLIVDPATGVPCAPDQVGEVCVAGGSVSTGYWRQSGAGDMPFYRALPGAEPAAAGPWLRTGDLGFMDAEGHLFFAGRSRDVIVLRGIKHHSEDLEASLNGCHPALRVGEMAAFAVDDPGDAREHLVVVAEVERVHRHAPEADAIAEAVQITLSREHDLALDRLVLLKPGALPKTTSGKIQRGVCRELLRAGGLEPLAEWRRARAAG